MELNYYALILCIFTRLCPEQAFKYLETGNLVFDDIDMEHIIMLKKRFSYKQISVMYGTTPHAIYNRLRRYISSRKEDALCI